MKRLFMTAIFVFMAFFSFASKTDAVYNSHFVVNSEIKVAVLLPLFYENINELSFDEYNIDERRGRNYKCFSYISFYEGVRIALDNLERQGYKISLYVFDVGENDTNKMRQVLAYKQMQEMDLVISLVFKQCFTFVSTFCQTYHIPLINPMSSDNTILNNPYVFKIQPDDYSVSVLLIKYIQSKHSKDRIIVLYDDHSVNSDIINYWKENLPQISEKWTILNYRKNANKLRGYISKTDNNFIVSLTNKTNMAENKSYALNILNTLRSFKSTITLFASYEWLDYVGNDYKILQDMDIHFSLLYYNDYTNANFTNFIKMYRDNFKTEPDNIYAALGYDIINYFLPLIKEKGKDFIFSPTNINQTKMISRYKFVRQDTAFGWQNTNSIIYKLDNYKIKACWSF
ncbi:MAG: ABC transporter substrate-binding protein [Bacteroidales bacterium]